MSEEEQVVKVEEGEIENQQVETIDDNEIVAHQTDLSFMTVDDFIHSNKVVRILYECDHKTSFLCMMEEAMMRARGFGVFSEFFDRWLAYEKKRNACPQSMLLDLDIPGLENFDFRLIMGKWHCDKQGVYFYKQKGNEFVKEVVSLQPFLPIKILKDRLTGTEKIIVGHRNFNEWYAISEFREVLANKNKIVLLGNKGFPVTTSNAKNVVDYIFEIISLNPQFYLLYYSTNRLGWHGRDCVPYTGNIELDEEGSQHTLFEAMQSQKGTAEEWLDFMVPLMRKSVILRLSIATTAASLLIEPLKAQIYFFYLYGKSGVGKTVAMRCAMSLWGNPDDGKLVVPINSTDNAKMKRAGALYNFTYAADEAQTEKGDQGSIERSIMLMGGGSERGRMMEDSLTWKNNFFYTGEDELTHINSGGGVMNRVLEVEVQNDEPIFEDGGKAARFVLSHYGTVGRLYVQKLREYSHKQLLEDYDAMKEMIFADRNITEKQGNAAALVALGDYLFHKFVLDEAEPDLTEVISTLQKTCKKKEEVDVGIRAQEYMIDCLYENIKSFYNEDTHTAPVNSLCFGKIQNGIFYISKTRTLDFLGRQGFSYRAATKTWKGTGFLLTNSQGRYTIDTTVNGHKETMLMLNPNAVMDKKRDADA